MCVLFMFVDNEAGPGQFQLIIANNRDEVISRPTRPAARWPDHKCCISGVDLQPGRPEGGTWLGISETSRVACLLNVLQNHPPDQDKKGRGHLVTDFLTQGVSAEDFMAPLIRDRQQYNPFNLVLLEKQGKVWETHYFNNGDEDGPKKMEPGVWAFGNSHPLHPWKKVVEGQRIMEEIIKEHNSQSSKVQLEAELMKLLTNTECHFPDPVLEHQGRNYLPNDLMKDRSAMFFCSKDINYGSRTNTVILIDGNGNGEYIERDLKSESGNLDNPVWETVYIPFTI